MFETTNFNKRMDITKTICLALCQCENIYFKDGRIKGNNNIRVDIQEAV